MLVTALFCAITASAPSESERALALAASAFEYRDMKKVIEILEPWVHPPRIAEPQRLVDARRLLGIAYHVEGRLSDAKDEFSAILLARPSTRLDPFLVPPEVIETFETLRREMATVLETPPPPPPSVTPPPSPSRLSPLVPFGLGHIVAMDQPGWGVAWMLVQLGGLGANIGGYHAANALVTNGFVNGDRDALETMHAVQIAGIVVFLAGWVAGVVQGELALSPAPAPPSTAGSAFRF